MNEQRIITLASRLVTAGITQDSEEIEKISSELAAELRQQTNENGDETYAPPPLKKDITGFLKFTHKEILKMPKSIRRTFIAEGQVIYYRKRKRCKYTYTYEARYRRHGYNISVSASDPVTLKERFIEKLQKYNPNAPVIPQDFDGFAMYWFENFHKRKVGDEHYKKGLTNYNKYLKPLWGNMKLKNIYAPAIQKLLDELSDRHRLTEDIYSLLNQIFTCAVKHGVLNINPIGMCFYQSKEREHGKAISKGDEIKLLSAYQDTDIQIIFAIMLYTGLRPNEYATAEIDGKFIKAKNSKRKNGKIEFKRIPITPMLRPYVERLDKLPGINMKTLDRRFKAILPEHKMYDMRTTFQTRCDQCGIPDRVIGIFMGNSIGKNSNTDSKLKNTYTDLEDKNYLDYLYKEGQKLNY